MENPGTKGWVRERVTSLEGSCRNTGANVGKIWIVY